MRFRLCGLTCLLSILLIPLSHAAQTTESLYNKHCASCHSANRFGSIGPALLPQNLKRLRKKKAIKVISNGRAATQMPAFAKILGKSEISALVDYIYTAPAQAPAWDMAAIKHSHIIHYRNEQLPAKPQHKSDPLNLFIVVELGDHHATIMDGDRFEPLHRFKTRFALHGGPKYSPDGHYVYFASRDGWISKFDMYSFKVVAEIRAGINTRNLAVSADGRYVMVGNYLPNSLVLLDARDLRPMRIFEVKDQQGKASRVSAVYTAAPRDSFIAALKDVKEVWEINYSDNPPPGFSGWEHNYNEESGDVIKPAPFPLRRIPVSVYLDDFFFNQEYDLLMGASREGDGIVLSLDTRKVISKLDIPGMPHLGSGIIWQYKGRDIMATPNLKEGVISIIDMDSFETIKRIKTLGPGFFMRSHENSDYAWVDVFFGKNKEAVHVIDKKSLKIVKTLRPAPGKTAAHVEFDRYGRHVVLSIWDMDGEIIIYDAKSLKEIKRLPMVKPSGKYNVYNKINLSAGTSH